MKNLIFKCQFLSDIVLNAQTATEGSQDLLEYIPGSNFLGIAAAGYNSLAPEAAYDIFHSGKVRFGDGHLAQGESRAVKAPLSWYINKGTTVQDQKWVHHLLSQETLNDLQAKGLQLKQVRTGWIVLDGDEKIQQGSLITPSTSFAIKSGYDRENRRSAEGKLYGYRALSAGSEWLFEVECDLPEHEEWLIKRLEGKRNIGRSRTAQYGRVEISHLETKNDADEKDLLAADTVVLYADSRLAFHDLHGAPSFQPTAEQLGFPGWKVDWDKCQINTGYFAPWNGKLKRRIADRAFIDKGSVFVLKRDGIESFSTQARYVGDYQNEGFGRIIIDPHFMKGSAQTATCDFKVVKAQATAPALRFILDGHGSDDDILAYIGQQEEKQQQEQAIYKDVRAFITEHGHRFGKITPSQWGQIRSIAATSVSMDHLINLLFSTVSGENLKSYDHAQSGFLRHGKVKELWTAGVDYLQQELEAHRSFGPSYAVILAAHMQKQAQRKGEKI